MKDFEDNVYTQYKYNRKPKKIIEKIINIVKSMDKNAKILSVGSGDGYVERYIVEHAKRDIICLDLSLKGVSLAQKRDLKVFLGSVYNLPFKSNSYDLVLAVHIFEHLIQPEAFLQEINRILKKNGDFFMSLPNYGNLAYRIKYLIKGSLDTFLQIRLGHFRHYTYDEACKFLEQHNFKITKKMTFLFGSQYIGFLPKIHKGLFSFSTLLLSKPQNK